MRNFRTTSLSISLAFLGLVAQARAAETYLHIDNHTKAGFDFTVDGSYRCHAPGVSNGFTCSFSSNCASATEGVAPGHSACVSVALAPGNHTVVAQSGGRTFTSQANLLYDAGGDDGMGDVIPPKYSAICELTPSATGFAFSCAVRQ